jgi:hypothetical protein
MEMNSLRGRKSKTGFELVEMKSLRGQKTNLMEIFNRQTGFDENHVFLFLKTMGN